MKEVEIDLEGMKPNSDVEYFAFERGGSYVRYKKFGARSNIISFFLLGERSWVLVRYEGAGGPKEALFVVQALKSGVKVMGSTFAPDRAALKHVPREFRPNVQPRGF